MSAADWRRIEESQKGLGLGGGVGASAPKPKPKPKPRRSASPPSLPIRENYGSGRSSTVLPNGAGGSAGKVGGLDAAIAAALGGAGGAQGRRAPYTAQELADAKKQQQQLLAAHLAGPFTPEAILSGYASTVAGLYGVNHPRAEAMAQFGMDHKMNQTTFSQWLRSRPDFAGTEVGRKMRADALAVVAQVFGYS